MMGVARIRGRRLVGGKASVGGKPSGRQGGWGPRKWVPRIMGAKDTGGQG